MSINSFQEELSSNISKVGDKAKITVAMLVAAFGLQQAEAQQVVKNRQGNTIKQLTLGNGTLLPNITGTKNADIGNSEEGGVVNVRTANNISTGINASTYSATTLPNETIASNTLTRQPGSVEQNTRTTQPNPEVSLSFTRKRARVDTNGDGLIDGIITTRDTPILQTTLAPIPVNTKIRLTTPALQNIANGATLTPSKSERYNRDGTNRVLMATSPGGVIMPVLEDRGTFMGVNDFSAFGEASVYPNPSDGRFTIQTNNPNDKKVEIYDLSGQMVSRIAINGESSEIDISSLATGPYVLITLDADRNKTMNKIIKN